MNIIKMMWLGLMWSFGCTMVLAMDHGSYRVAVDAEYAPYEFQAVDGSVQGMLPDMLRAMAMNRDQRVEFLPMSWPDAMDALASGEVDVVSMIPTPHRREKFDFSQPHSVISQALFRYDAHDEINALAALSGHKVALQRFDLAAEKLAARDDIQPLMVNRKESGFLLLDAGKVHAFVTAEQPGLFFLTEHALKHVELVAMGLWSQPFCFAVKKGDESTLAFLNQGIEQLKQSGRYSEIVQQWRVQPQAWWVKQIQGLLMLGGLFLLLSLLVWIWMLRRAVKQRTSAWMSEQSKLAAVVDYASEGIFLLDGEGQVLRANPRVGKMFGYTIPMLKEMHIQQLVTGWYDGGENAGGVREFEGQRVDGSLFPCLVTLNVFQSEAGKRCSVIIHDLTMRKRNEREIARLNEAVNQISDIIFQLDASGCVKYMNQSGLSFFGASLQAVVGQPFSSFVPDEMLASLEETFALKAQGVLHETTYEVLFKGVQTQPCPMEVKTCAIVEHGEFMGVYGVARDISERKQAELKINRLYDMVETSMDFVCMLDMDGRVLYINKSGDHLLGFKHGEHPSDWDISDWISASELKRLNEKLLPLAMEKGGYQTELTLLNVDGEAIPVLAALGVQRTREGLMDGYAVIAHDLRHEREQRQQLEHVQRLDSLGVLAGGIAHDFNNILSVILGNAELAQGQSAMRPDVVEGLLKHIVHASEKAALLCQQMLAYSGKGSFVIRPVNLSKMVEEIASLLQVSIGNSVALEFALALDLPSVEADVAQMQQVVMNLVMNASDAMEDQRGVIRMETGVMQVVADEWHHLYGADDFCDGRYVFLDVSDNGCGMSLAVMQRVFEPFFTTKFDGHGLGMSAVLGIVRAHRGAIIVESEEGKGSRFRLLLPMLLQQTAAVEALPVGQQAWRGEGVVLVIDDEQGIQKVMGMMFENMGFEVLLASGGEQGVALYQQHQQDVGLILLDMSMPNMDGKACYRALTAINPKVKVILSSGYSEAEASARFAEDGLVGFIQKPCRSPALQAMVQSVLSVE